MPMPSAARDEEPRPSIDDAAVPAGVVIAGSWGWRALTVVAVVAVFGLLVSALSAIVIPLVVAILVASLLVPVVAQLRSTGWPSWLAVVVALLVTLGSVAALAFLVVDEISDALPSLIRQTLEAYRDARGFLTGGPFHFTPEQLHGFYRDVLKAFQSNTNEMLARAASVGSWLGRFVTGLLLAIFATVILLVDGPAVWRFVVTLFPGRARGAVHRAGREGFAAVTRFVRTQLAVAVVDAVGVGVLAGALRIPLAIPIAVVVFLGAFVPIVGTVVTGIIAVFVALVYNGPVAALVLLLGVIVIQALEGFVFRRLVNGHPLDVHPLAVVFGVAVGARVAGPTGAVFAVPTITAITAIMKSLGSGRLRQPHRPDEDDMVPPSRAAQKGTRDDV